MVVRSFHHIEKSFESHAIFPFKELLQKELILVAAKKRFFLILGFLQVHQSIGELIDILSALIAGPLIHNELSRLLVFRISKAIVLHTLCEKIWRSQT